MAAVGVCLFSSVEALLTGLCVGSNAVTDADTTIGPCGSTIGINVDVTLGLCGSITCANVDVSTAALVLGT
jgi:hypothetical protein